MEEHTASLGVGGTRRRARTKRHEPDQLKIRGVRSIEGGSGERLESITISLGEQNNRWLSFLWYPVISTNTEVVKRRWDIEDEEIYSRNGKRIKKSSPQPSTLPTDGSFGKTLTTSPEFGDESASIPYSKTGLQGDSCKLPTAMQTTTYLGAVGGYRAARTWRINDIPISVTKEALRAALGQLSDELVVGSTKESNVLELSLAPYSARSSCATVTFRVQPSFLPENRGSCSFKLPGLILGNGGGENSVPVEVRFDDRFLGFTPLYDSGGGRESVDLIAVPGLGSHALGSFKSPSGYEIWLRDFLPQDVANIRVLLYGYDTTLAKSDSRMSIVELAKILLESVKAIRERTNTMRRPIIFIGHSLGGLLIKEALVLASASDSIPENLDVFNACYGLIFFGVPNEGLRNEQLQAVVAGQPNSQLVRDLVVDEASEPKPLLVELGRKFREIYNSRNLKIISFYETKESPVVEESESGVWTKTGRKTLMVTRASAARIGGKGNYHDQLPLDADHSGLVKFNSRVDPNYEIVVLRIQSLVNGAPQTVNARGDIETELSPEELAIWHNLNRPPFSEVRDYKINDRDPETLNWFLRDLKFNSWRDSANSEVLWIKGSPGQGKSVLSKFIVEHLERHCEKSCGMTCRVIYFFCFKQEGQFRTAPAILRALILQLAKYPKMMKHLPLAYRGDKEFFSAPISNLWNIFYNLINDDCHRHTYCVIDALDECSFDSGRRDLLCRLKLLFSNNKLREGAFVKLFITSRPSEKDIEDQLGDFPYITLQAVSQDLDRFIWSQVKSLPEDEFGHLEDELLALLHQQVGHTFLWVSIIMKELRALTFPNLDDVRSVVAQSPKDLDKLYQVLVERLIKHDVIARILTWVVFARRPLRLTELEAAITMDPGKEYKSLKDALKSRRPITATIIARRAGTLLEVIGGSVFLVHQSVKDFFDRHNPLGDIRFCNRRDPGLFLAETCIQYLSCEEFDVIELDTLRPIVGLREEFHLLLYASTEWYDHIKTESDAIQLLSKMRKILNPKSRNAVLWMLYNMGGYRDRRLTRLTEIAVEFDIHWLAELLLHGKCPEKENFENQFLPVVAAKAPKVLKSIICNSGDNMAVTEEVLKEAAGNRKSDKEIVTLLLDRYNGSVVTEEVLKAAASNSNSGKEMMVTLLDRRGGEIKITGEVVRAAAKNWRCGVMALLLDRRGDEIKINEKILEVAVRNLNCNMMKLLLDRRGNEIEITEKVVEAAAGNRGCGKEMMALLLDRRGAEVKITEEVAKAAAGNAGSDMMTLLLDRKGDEVKVTEEVVKAAVGNRECGVGVMTALLDRRGTEVKITEELVEVAAGNAGSDMMTLLLDRKGNEVKVTEGVVNAAVGNWRCSVEVMTTLLDRRGNEIEITEEVVEAAARNPGCGKEMVALLLDRGGTEVKITEEVVEAAAGNAGSDMMTLLLDRKGNEIKVTEEVVKAAVGNWICGVDMMTVLLDQRGTEVKITEKVVKAAARNRGCGKEMVALLLDRRGTEVKITEGVVEAAAGNANSDMMILLLDRKGNEVKVTEEVVKAAVGNSRCGVEMVTTLLDRRGNEIEITEKVVEAAAGNQECGKEVVALLLDRKGTEVKITEKAVEAAAGNANSDMMMLLLDRKGNEIKVTEEVVKAAAGNWRCGVEMMTTLLDRRGNEIEITEKVVEAAAGNQECGMEVVALLLDRRGTEVKITEKAVEAAAGNANSDMMILLLDRKGNEIKVTEEVVKAAVGNWRCGVEMMTALLDRRDNEIEITEEVVEAAARNWRCGKEMVALLLDRRGGETEITEEAVVATAGGRKGPITTLLDRRGSEIKITEEVVKAAAGNCGCGMEVVTLLLDRRDSEIEITEGVVKAAAEGDNAKGVIAVLLDRRGSEIKITEGVVKAAAGNLRCGMEAVTLLLDRRGSDIKVTEEVVKVAAGNRECGMEIMTLLLDRRSTEIKITEETMKAAGSGSAGVMMLLLDRRDSEIKITKEVVEAVAGNASCDMMTLLLDRKGNEVEVTEEVVKAAMRNWRCGVDMMTTLLDRRDTEIKITEEIVEAAAGNASCDIMTLLLDRKGNEVKVTEEVVKAAVGNWRCGVEMMTTLLDRKGTEVKITEEVVEAAVRGHNAEVVTALLDRRGHEIKITEKVVEAAAGNRVCGKGIVALLLDRKGSEIKVTEKVVKVVVGNETCGKDLMVMLLDFTGSIIITESIIEAAATAGQEQVLDLMAERCGTDLSRSTWVMIAQLYNAAKGGNSELVQHFLQRGVCPDMRNANGMSPLWWAASGGHGAVVRLLLESHAVDINCRSASGWSPLFCAAANGHKEVVKLLLDEGAERDFRVEGQTLLSIARSYNRWGVVKILEEYKKHAST